MKKETLHKWLALREALEHIHSAYQVLSRWGGDELGLEGVPTELIKINSKIWEKVEQLEKELVGEE